MELDDKMAYKKYVARKIKIQSTLTIVLSVLAPVLSLLVIFNDLFILPFCIVLIALMAITLKGGVKSPDQLREKQRAKMEMLNRRGKEKQRLEDLKRSQKEAERLSKMMSEDTRAALNISKESLVEFKEKTAHRVDSVIISSCMIDVSTSFFKLIQLFEEREDLASDNIYILQTLLPEVIESVKRYRTTAEYIDKSSPGWREEMKAVRRDTIQILVDATKTVDNLRHKIIQVDVQNQKATRAYFEQRVKEIEALNEREFDPSSLNEVDSEPTVVYRKK